jgi:hypothetical protein
LFEGEDDIDADRVAAGFAGSPPPRETATIAARSVRSANR